MYRENQDQLEQDMAPFGFVVNGLEDENIGQVLLMNMEQDGVQ